MLFLLKMKILYHPIWQKHLVQLGGEHQSPTRKSRIQESKESKSWMFRIPMESWIFAEVVFCPKKRDQTAGWSPKWWFWKGIPFRTQLIDSDLGSYSNLRIYPPHLVTINDFVHIKCQPPWPQRPPKVFRSVSTRKKTSAHEACLICFEGSSRDVWQKNRFLKQL